MRVVEREVLGTNFGRQSGERAVIAIRIRFLVAQMISGVEQIIAARFGDRS